MSIITSAFVITVHDEILDDLMVDIVESQVNHETLALNVSDFLYDVSEN